MNRAGGTVGSALCGARLDLEQGAPAGRVAILVFEYRFCPPTP